MPQADVVVTVGGPVRFRRAEKILSAVELGMVRAGNDIIRAVQRYTPRYKQRLIQSFRFTRHDRPRRIVIDSPLAWSPVMALGRRPGSMPPVAPLIEWAAYKFGLTSKDAIRAGWGIAVNMARSGIQVPLKVSGLGAMYDRGFRTAGGAAMVARRIRDEVRRVGRLA